MSDRENKQSNKNIGSNTGDIGNIMRKEYAEKPGRLEECILYFKERKVYQKLFSKFREKYISLGHFGGTVQLSGLDNEERQHLGGFFQKDYMGKKTISISATAMEKALENSRFAGLMWDDILRSYFREELIGKKEQKQQETFRRERYFADIMSEMPGNPGVLWLERVLQTQGEGYMLLMKQYREQQDILRENLRLFLKAVPGLPFQQTDKKHVSHELLAVFAAETTGNPHFFDAGMLGEQLLTAFLRAHIPNQVGRTSFRTEEKAELFYEAGLLKDDLSNNTLVYGIHGIAKGGKPHEGIAGFGMQREPMLLTLMTLGKLQQVQTQEDGRVYVVENPAVFSKMIKTFQNATVVCGNGQIRLATLVLLDLFDEEIDFWYAGDFDPEGLLIAQKLKERYGKRLHMWKYSREFYEKYQSQVEISAKSLKKLDRIYLEELQDMKQAMLQQKRATYQETMMSEYLQSDNSMSQATKPFVV